MSLLNVDYMGIKMKNPVLAASCSLTGTVESIRQIAEAGAGGIVLKSIFQEQFERDTMNIERHIGPSWHTEAFDYVRNMSMELGPEQYLRLIEETRKITDIPLIASLNCVSSDYWLQYAAKLEQTGIDGLELNIAYLPASGSETAKDVEHMAVDVVERVCRKINMPVAVKLGAHYTAFANFADKIFKAGAKALVLFNRFYQVDIDINNLSYKPGYRFSSQEEAGLPMRWIALLSNQITCDFSATTGIHTGENAVKMILAGAKTVQICSALYMNKISLITDIVRFMEDWMKQKGFESIESFRGRLARTDTERLEILERLQYIKALVGIE
jgi:dihydroorotate dehydrogenase (fumarate)